MSNELRQVLQEKENLLSEAAGLLREAESVHSMRLEASLSEKADVEADLEVCMRMLAGLFVFATFMCGLLRLCCGLIAGLFACFAPFLCYDKSDDDACSFVLIGCGLINALVSWAVVCATCIVWSLQYCNRVVGCCCAFCKCGILDSLVLWAVCRLCYMRVWSIAVVSWAVAVLSVSMVLWTRVMGCRWCFLRCGLRTAFVLCSWYCAISVAY